LEGEATATYLSRLLLPMGVKVSRLASGLPVGGDLEYADEVTLGRAFEGRRYVDAWILIPLCRKLRSRSFPTLCTACNLCKPPATYVNVGFSQSRECDSDCDVAVLGMKDAEFLAGLVQDPLHGKGVRKRHDHALGAASAYRFAHLNQLVGVASTQRWPIDY